VSLTPPGRPAHTFGYRAVDLMADYTAPDIGGHSTATRYTYISKHPGDDAPIAPLHGRAWVRKLRARALSSYTASYSSNPMFQKAQTRDDLGRITRIVEILQNVTDTIDYDDQYTGSLESPPDAALLIRGGQRSIPCS
jgi:hypothetical protein